VKGRDLVADLVAAAKASPFARCVYCGHRAYGRACEAHKDLPQLEAVHAAASQPDGG
jgi:hypothetical protein